MAPGWRMIDPAWPGSTNLVLAAARVAASLLYWLHVSQPLARAKYYGQAAAPVQGRLPNPIVLAAELVAWLETITGFRPN